MENIKEKMELILSLMGYFGFVVMNYLNFGGDRGSWVYDRIIIVRCDNVILEEKQDKNLIEHLLEEKEYIVSLAIRGLKQVIDNGYKYNIPASCKVLNEDYQVENHSFLAFYKECIVDREPYGNIDDHCTTARLYKIYEAWCKDNNNGYKEAKGEVKKILEEMGKAEIKKTNGYTYYKAITLSYETKRDYESIYYDFDHNRHDKPEQGANMPDIEETRKDLGLDNDSSLDFSKNDIPNPDDFDINNLQPDDLHPSEEKLREAGLYDIDLNNNGKV